MNVGTRIRSFREMRGLSLRNLSERSGVSPSFLSQLENGHTNASVSSLHRIAGALGVTVADLFDPDLERPRSVLRAADRPQLPMEAGARKYVISRSPVRNVEIYVAEFEPGGSTGDELYAHGDSQEFFIVVRGKVRYFLGDEEFQMRVGDSIEHQSSAPHGVRNASATTAEVIWIAAPPTPDEVTSTPLPLHGARSADLASQPPRSNGHRRRSSSVQ